MREIPCAHLDWEKVRAYTNSRANASSLRTLAPEIGLGHSTLHNFLSGADPHPRVRALIGAWYVRETGDDGEAGIIEPRGGATLRAALDIMVRYFPEEDRVRVRQNAAALLVDESTLSGLDVPLWLAECVRVEGMRRADTP